MKRYYNICPRCGGSLDPGEKCDCQKMRGRDYTDIEGAGYRIIRMEEPEEKERTGRMIS